MPGTFHQIYIQVVFAVKGRENLIGNNWKTDLHKYIAGIIKGKKQKPIIVNGMPDHSSNFVNDHKLVKGKFSWQDGYRAFSYSHSHIKMCKIIF